MKHFWFIIFSGSISIDTLLGVIWTMQSYRKVCWSSRARAIIFGELLCSVTTTMSRLFRRNWLNDGSGCPDHITNWRISVVSFYFEFFVTLVNNRENTINTGNTGKTGTPLEKTLCVCFFEMIRRGCQLYWALGLLCYISCISALKSSVMLPPQHIGLLSYKRHDMPDLFLGRHQPVRYSLHTQFLQPWANHIKTPQKHVIRADIFVMNKLNSIRLVERQPDPWQTNYQHDFYPQLISAFFAQKISASLATKCIWKLPCFSLSGRPEWLVWIGLLEGWLWAVHYKTKVTFTTSLKNNQSKN